MLEKLADYDDELMEGLLGDIEPPRDLVFDDLARELKERHVVPVLIGAATTDAGVRRLLALAFKDRVRDLEKALARDMALAPLKDDLVAAAIDRTLPARLWLERLPQVPESQEARR